MKLQPTLIPESRRPPFQKSSTVSQMKYVRPYTLFKQLQKKTRELKQRKSLGDASLLGLCLMGDYVSVSYCIPEKGLEAEPNGIVRIKKRDIDDIANDFRKINLIDDVAGYVIGLPVTKKKVNPQAARVKNFVADLSGTRQLEGLKYTYLDESLALKHILETQDPHFEREFSVGIIQEYYDLYLKEHYPQDDEDYF